MENLAHTCVGYVLARTGLGNWTSLGAAALVIGANLPDIDVLYTQFGDHTTYLEHHRGLSHSLLGLLGLSVLQASILRLVQMRRHVDAGAAGHPFLKLWLLSLIGVSSHFLLDFTNTYGVRPWIPFDDRWYYGDMVFIVDPWIWMILGAPCVWLTMRRWWQGAVYGVAAIIATILVFAFREGAAPVAAKILWLAGLAITLAVWFRYRDRWSHRVAIGALVALALYWAGLKTLHDMAEARVATAESVRSLPEQARRIAVLPTPVSLLNWMVIIETERLIYTGEVRLWDRGSPLKLSPPRLRNIDHADVKTALTTAPGQAMLRFARFLAADVLPEAGASLVTLRDIRFGQTGIGGFAVVAIPITRRPD